ncbi:MAG: alpha-ketoacid dehydrogenase subunit beta [Elusimicrobia bacterium]|nr:alpha-ketoacid dehydrogenase subunit beta [Elusimicrobiota bacterium]MDE2236347.1 alpha-ketoacid dehydrogenase subunit beta [Elusimicrobiota bacterium]MDE2426062.1 alpha-ketoacid dehydrogenase subunit beta [Elusimicrobiota bacterium]
MANMAQAIRLALHYGEERLGVREIFGEDVGPPLGGVFTATQGLKTAWNSPLDERGIVGAALGLAWAGSRPVAEVQFVDYIFNSIDLLKLCGNGYWSSAGLYPAPLVLMTPTGSGIHGSIYHSHSFDSMAAKLHGMKVVCPSTPLDAYGLMISAIKDDAPVLYLKPKALLRGKGEELLPGEPADEKELRSMIDAPIGDRSRWKPRWPDIKEYEVPIGQAKISHPGQDATVVTHGRMAPIALDVARQLAEEGRGQVEVIDLRSLIPYDWDCVKASISKTGRVLFLNEETEIANLGEHLIRRVVDELFYELKVRPRLLCGKATPGIGLSPNLENFTQPQKPDVERALGELLREPA